MFLLNFALFAASVVLYGLVAPGAGRGGLTMWLGFALGQAYVVARLWVKLVFWASETALFQAASRTPAMSRVRCRRGRTRPPLTRFKVKR